MTTAIRGGRWSFRNRLTALIAAVFVVGGIALLGVQYLLVRGLFDTAIDGLVGCVDENSVTVTSRAHATSDGDCVQLPIPSDAAGGQEIAVGTDGAGITIEQTTMLSQEVLSGLVLWSIVTLLIFTVIAIVAASWLSKRSFARIGQITAITKRITRHDMHQRLDLPGPADEIKELGDTIDTMLDGLEASFTQQERFITNASHELRTPLTTNRTALEIPLEQGRVPEHLEPAIRRALDANQRSEQLIAALLQLARTTSADDERSEPVDLPALVEQILAARSDAIDRTDLSVTTDLAPTVAFSPDPTLLTIAVENLIDNAIRHNHEGGELCVATGTGDHRSWIQITNTGPRYSDDEAARLIEPFNRGHQTRTTAAGGNLGLGLTLVQNVADLHGAALTLAPESDGGLVVRMEFP